MTVTLELEDSARPAEIKNILRNIKGIIKVSTYEPVPLNSSNKESSEDKDWLGMIEKLRNSVSPTDIDMSDERTRYIMGEDR